LAGVSLIQRKLKILCRIY